MRSFWRNDSLLWILILVSIGIHAVVFELSRWPFRSHEKEIVEIEMNAAAPQPATRQPAPVSRKAVTPPRPLPVPKEERSVPAPPMPTPPPPVAQPPQAAAPTAPQEYAIGTGESTAFSRLPKLLNSADLLAILRRYYPESARQENRSATVVMDIHIDIDGHVTSADLIGLGDTDFDQAAKQVALLLRYSPAFLDGKSVAVRMRQAIQFKLER